MISKITSLKSGFRGVVMFATKEHKEYEVMMAEGVRAHDPKLTIEDFKIQASFNTRIAKNCLHVILSHHPDDGLKIAGREREILKDYLNVLKGRGIDFHETQFIIYKHNDKGYAHYHIVANMVNDKVKRFNDSHIGYKMKYTSKEITKKYGLTPAVRKELQEIVRQQDYAIDRAIAIMNNVREGSTTQM